MKPLSLAQDLTIRLLMAILFTAVAWAGTGLILEKTKRSVLLELGKSAQHSASYVERWLSEKSQVLNSLTEDSRLIAIEDMEQDSLTYPLPLRQALYEFSILKKLPNTYLVSPKFGKKSFNTTNAVPLPEEINNWLQGLLKTETYRYIRFLTVGTKDYILVADTFKHPETNKSLLYTVYMEPLDSAFLTLTLPQFSRLGDNYKIPLFNRSDIQTVHGYPNLKNPRIQLKNTLITSDISSFFHTAEHTGKTSFFGPQLMATQQLLLFPDWYVALSVKADFAASESSIFRLAVMFLAFFCSVVVLFWQTKGGWTKWVRLHTEKKSKPLLSQNYNYATFERRNILKKNLPYDAAKRKNRIKVIGRKKSPEMVLYDVIKESLAKHHTKLLYQPIFDAQTNNIVMHEVYLRILNENGDVLCPAEFLPIADRFGFLPSIDNYVVSRVTDLHLSTKKPEATLAINLAGDTFESISFLETLMTTLKRKHARHMVLELRSQEIIKDPDAMAFIDKCRLFGCPFSIDYFGGGESMLQASKRMKFNYVKLDCQNFEKTTSSKKDLIKLSKRAKELGISLILEKIETKEMADFARMIGIPYLQGYFLSKPEDFIQKNN